MPPVLRVVLTRQSGDVLLIVPPMFVVDRACLGVHLLKSCADKAGIDISLLYANLSLASQLGEPRYTKTTTWKSYPYHTMLGERLFARVAHQLPQPPHWRDVSLDPSRVFGRSRSFQQAWERVSEREQLPLTSAEFDDFERQLDGWADRVAQAVVERGYRLVGCTTSFAQTNASFALLTRIKRLQPSVVTIIGGRNCDGEMAQGIASLDPTGEVIDHIFSGESEATFVDFLCRFRKGSRSNRRIITGQPCDDLDALPPPDFTEYLNQLRHFSAEPAESLERVALIYETSRGCWWGAKRQCTFCGVNSTGLRYRRKSNETVLADLRHFAEAYPHKRVYLNDSAMNPEQFESLMPELAALQLPLSFASAQRANLSLTDVLRLKAINSFFVEPGVEFFSSSFLSSINKGTKTRHNIQLLRYSRAANLNLVYAILCGVPGDRLSQYRQMFELFGLMRHLMPPAALYHLSIDRFSPYFSEPEKYGITHLEPLGTYREVFPPGADVDKLAFHFVGEYECDSHRHLEVLEALVREIEEWRAAWENTEGEPVALQVVQTGGQYLLFDSRQLPGNPPMQFLDEAQARAALVGRRYAAIPEIEWALMHKVGVVLDDWYIPLAVADVELLRRFEAEQEEGEPGR